jgi:hypothetical protein
MPDKSANSLGRVQKMPRIARLVVSGEPAVYHVMSRTALPGFVLGDVEKDYLCDLIRKLSLVYFSEVLQRFKRNFLSKKDKKPFQIPGLPDIFSLKRLSES